MAIQQAIQAWDAALPNHTFSLGGVNPMLMFQRLDNFSGPECARTVGGGYEETGERVWGIVQFPPSAQYYNYQESLKNASHEMGHFVWIGPPRSRELHRSKSVMEPTPTGQCLRTIFPPNFQAVPSAEDANKAKQRSGDVTINSQLHRNEENACIIDYGNWDPYTCTCDYDNRGGLPGSGSPILISLGDSQFQLTDVTNGVPFDIDGDGQLDQMAWTTPNSTDAFLVLDRNFSRAIESGVELFGEYTPQPPSDERNGFLALALLESEEMGGVPDNRITPEDSAYGQLQLWFDYNHDGVAQAAELSSLSSHGILSIDLDYHTTSRRDRFGNQFRYSSLVHFADGRTSLAIDVFLVRR